MINTLKELVSIDRVCEMGEGGFPYGSGPAKALDCVLSKAEAPMQEEWTMLWPWTTLSGAGKR